MAGEEETRQEGKRVLIDGMGDLSARLFGGKIVRGPVDFPARSISLRKFPRDRVRERSFSSEQMKTDARN